jgi:hypothetical protein
MPDWKISAGRIRALRASALATKKEARRSEERTMQARRRREIGTRLDMAG